MTTYEEGARRSADDAAQSPSEATFRTAGASPLGSSTRLPAQPSAPADETAGRTPRGRSAHADNPASSAALFEAAQAIPRALQIAGSIIAPTTLLTALFVYFGLMYAVAYYRYFGVNYTVLDLPVEGYLILSASTAILPMALLAGAAMLSLWLYQLPLDMLSETARHRLYRWLYPVVVAIGLLLVGLTALDVLFAVVMYPVPAMEARGLSLVTGVVLLGYAGRLRRVLAPRRPAHGSRREAPVALTVAKWGSFCLLIGVGLFWAVGSYALRMGAEGARDFAVMIRCAPEVVLYSEKDLNLASSGLPNGPPPPTDGAYDSSYAGLKLVPQAGDSYLLVPADWSPGGRPAIVLPRSDKVRLEFVVGAARLPGC